MEVMPVGKRGTGMAAALQLLLANLFADRLPVFDREAAVTYASIVSRARAEGHCISIADGQIAAMACVRAFSVATRDIGPFRAAGLHVMDPCSA
jgi:predicted nucleic acid-binding protein